MPDTARRALGGALFAYAVIYAAQVVFNIFYSGLLSRMEVYWVMNYLHGGGHPGVRCRCLEAQAGNGRSGHDAWPVPGGSGRVLLHSGPGHMVLHPLVPVAHPG